MQATDGAQSIFFLVLIVISASLVRKGRSDPASATLAPRQRVRPLALEWLDPVLALVVVGPVLWHELTLSVAHVGAGILGLVLGYPVGVLRARIQFVRAVTPTKSVVLTRSNAEYALVILLIILRSAESSIERQHGAGVTFLLTVLLAFAFGESAARSIAITQRYRQSAEEQPRPTLGA